MKRHSGERWFSYSMKSAIWFVNVLRMVDRQALSRSRFCGSQWLQLKALVSSDQDKPCLVLGLWHTLWKSLALVVALESSDQDKPCLVLGLWHTLWWKPLALAKALVSSDQDIFCLVLGLWHTLWKPLAFAMALAIAPAFSYGCWKEIAGLHIGYAATCDRSRLGHYSHACAHTGYQTRLHLGLCFT